MKRALALTAAAVVAVAGSAFAAGAGVSYSGKSRQHLRITLVLDAHGLVSGKYLANYYCVRPNGSVVRGLSQPTTLGRSSFVRPRHINYRQTTGGGANEDQTHLVATVSGAKITGFFDEAYINRFGILCHSGKISFSASH